MRAWLCSFMMATTSISNAQDLHFQHVSIDDGLSDNAITCVHEDRAGFLWIGTENGLNKYDGSTVQRLADTEASIAAVIEDRDGVIWAATKDDGLLRLGMDGRVRRFDRNDTLNGPMASDKLTALYDLDDTTLLIGSREVTMMFLDKRTLQFTYWTDSTSLAPQRASYEAARSRGWCHAITPLDDGRLWIGFLNSYLSCIADRRSLAITHYAHVLREGSQTLTCATLIDDTLYAGGWQNGLDLVALGDMTPGSVATSTPVRTRPTDEEVAAIARWGTNGLLLGIRQRGLLLMIPGREPQRIARSRSDAASLSSDRVRCLLRDRRGTLWVGTNNGLDYHVPEVWRFAVKDVYNDPLGDRPDVVFHRVEAEGSSGVRMFTSEGFFLQPEKDATIRHEPFTFGTRSLQPTISGIDHHGAVIFGTEYGIARADSAKGSVYPALEPKQGPVRFPLGDMFQVRGIQADTLDDRPVYVVATMGFGVQMVDATTQEVIGIPMPTAAWKSNSYSLVHGMTRDADRRYWFATANGLYSWHVSDGLLQANADGTVTQNKGMITVANEDVRQVEWLDGALWCIVRTGAVLRVQAGKVDRFVVPDHLQRDLYGMAADANGHFWITTNDGLLRFDTTTHDFLQVPVNIGTRFRKLGHAIATLNDGRIALCADNTLLTFNPADFDAMPALPAAIFTGASAAGRNLLVENGRVDLSYRSSVIDIGVSALALGQPQALLLEYKLDDVEQEWRTIRISERIRYAGVPVGTHRLLVKVRDAFGRTGPEQMLLTISVAAPFWLTWWFYALIALLVSVGVYAWSRYRLAQAMKLQAVRNKIASDLHDEVGSSLSSISIGSQLATQLSSAENEQVKQLMARIGETSSESLRSMSDIVWAIDPRNDEGEALVKRMRRIAQELLESKGIEVSFTMSGGVEDLKLPMNARKEIVLIYKEAVHNASKYSGASLVQVSLHRRNGSLTVSVKDDGRGFDPALHPDGHGLGSMKRRADQLQADLTLNSAPGLGTIVGVEVDLTRIRD